MEVEGQGGGVQVLDLQMQKLTLAKLRRRVMYGSMPGGPLNALEGWRMRLRN